MAFTSEQIISAIENNPAWQRNVLGINEQVRKNNYDSIVNYLTGVSNSLSNTTQDYSSYHFAGLIDLIKNPATPDADDQRILDILNHPDFFYYINYHFHELLVKNLLEDPSAANLAAFHRNIKTRVSTDDEIFSATLNLYHVSNSEQDNINIEGSALQQYFVDYISRQPIATVKALYITPHNNNYWMPYLFSLMEQHRPELANDYLVWGLETDKSVAESQLSILIENPAYKELVLTMLKKGFDNDPDILYNHTEIALNLYLLDRNQFADIAVEVADAYLKYFIQSREDKNYESHTQVKNLLNDSYAPYSAACWMVLFQQQPQLAESRLKEFLDTNPYVNSVTLAVIAQHKSVQALKAFNAAFASKNSGNEYYAQVLDLLQQAVPPAQFLETAWKLVTHKSKPLRIKTAAVIANLDKDADEKAIALLNNKSADARQTAAIILGYFPGEKTKSAIMQVLDTEKNDNARDVLLQSVVNSLPPSMDETYIETMVQAAGTRGKLNDPAEPWLNEDQLPALYYRSGKTLDALTTRFLLYRMGRVKTMQSDIEARYIIQLLDNEKSALFAQHILQLYKANDTKPEHKYLMALAALSGDETVVDKIRITINQWIDEGRYKMAEYGVGALALQGSDKALRWVEWYSRKYQTKKANVGAAAMLALETAAEELNISIHELGDRIVPDFGFEGLFKHFDINGDGYRAFIDSNFKIAYFNDDDKKLKSLPAAASKELKDEFKDIAKEVRDVVKSQSSRMEYYLIIQRRWTKDQWQEFFLNNPIMFIYATKLVWATYDQHGSVTDTFMLSDDTTLLTAEQDEFELQDDAYIGMTHPTQLSEILLQQWKQVFFDASIETVFAQLDRKMPDIKKLDVTRAIIHDYNGKHMATGSIRSILERYGWHKGPTGDGGSVDSFNLLYHEKQMEAVLEVEGIAVAYGWGGDEKTGRLYFVNKNKAPGKWIGYISNDDDEKLVKLKDVPPIFLSEALAAIESIKAASAPGETK